MHPSHRARHGTTTLLVSISLKLLRLGWLYGCLGALCAVAYAPRHLPCVLRRIAILGGALSLAFEFVLRVPDFPFWSAMQIPIASVILLAVHRTLVPATKPASR